MTWKVSQSKKVKNIFIAPGNPGTATLGTNIPVAVDDLSALLQFAKEKKIDLTVVGPELPLSLGIVDLFQKNGLSIFGPTQESARIETDKAWAAQFMQKYHIPHPQSYIFNKSDEALTFLRQHQKEKWVMKASGLAAGKGVILPETFAQAQKTVIDILDKKIFGKAGDTLLIQERISGPEVSITALMDGKSMLVFPPSQDHKRAKDGDMGANTGGMGAYAPVPFVTDRILRQIKKDILQPVLDGMRQDGHPYTGILYPGLMLTEKGPMVLEFNARFGDPETEPLMMLLRSDLVQLLQACVDKTLHKQKLNVYAGSAATVILTAKGYPQSYEKGKRIRGFSKKMKKGTAVFQAGTTQVKGKIVTNGGRVLAVTARGKTLEKALQAVYGSIGAKRSQISFRGMRYRKDIGYQVLAVKDKHVLIPHRIAVIQENDTRENVKKDFLWRNGFAEKITRVRLADVYTIDKQLTDEEVITVASSFINPVAQRYVLNSHNSPEVFLPIQDVFDYVLEIGYYPGVTDNVAMTAEESIQDMLGNKFIGHEKVYTSQLLYLTGKLSRADVEKIGQSFANPLIQSIRIKDYRTYVAEFGMTNPVPRVHLHEKEDVLLVHLNVDDAELEAIGKKGIVGVDGNRRGPLALDLPSMKAIQGHFRILQRKPTDIELESIAQTWSEHCKHTIFSSPIDDKKEGLFKSYIQAATEVIRNKKSLHVIASRAKQSISTSEIATSSTTPRNDEVNGDFCVSVFSDNSGAISFDDEFLVTHKVETHNSPSALDPFGGAITGIVGVNRDTIGFGKGAKPVANTYGFCFADPRLTSPLYKDKELNQPMLLPKRILEGVVQGVNVGGNCSGIPTPQGFVYFDERYQGKPLVFVGTVGLIPRTENEKDLTKKKAMPGDYIVMIGGRVGKDGIHGATFSSEAIDSGSPATAVQIGDPITQKKLSDVIVKEIRQLDVYNSITDNGAGGLSCSVAEMAKESNGCEVHLEDVPLKYPGLAPWEIWISESQERMTLAVPEGKWKQFAACMEKRGVEASIIGIFTDSGKCKVLFHEKVIMDLSLQFLHYGVPLKHLRTEKRMRSTEDTVSGKSRLAGRVQNQSESILDKPESLSKPETHLLDMLSRPSIASFAFISSQYDHEVQGSSVLKPLQGKGSVNADATVLKPRLDSPKGIVLSQALYPEYTEMDGYRMAAAGIDTAIRNCIAVGADIEKIALLDNFCWCDPYNPTRLAQLKDAAKGCYDYAVVYGTPFISGKDSMFNDFKGFDAEGNPVVVSIPPTLLISSIGIIPDAQSVVSQDVKESGDLVYILGDTYEEIGGTEYLRYLSEKYKKDYAYVSIPKVDAKRNKKRYQTLTSAIAKGYIASAISISHGGLLTALAKMSMAGRLGMSVDLRDLPGVVNQDMFAFYSESQGRLLVSIAPKNQAEFEELFSEESFALIGEVRNDSLFRVKGLSGEMKIRTDVETMLASYRSTFNGC